MRCTVSCPKQCFQKLSLGAVVADHATLATQLFRRSWLFLLSISVLVMLTVMVFAAPLVTLLFGSAYAPATPLVQILAVSLIPYTFSAAWSVRRVVQGQERRVMLALAVSLTFALILNRWLIPLLGANGTAYAVVISESSFAVILLAWRH